MHFDTLRLCVNIPITYTRYVDSVRKEINKSLEFNKHCINLIYYYENII